MLCLSYGSAYVLWSVTFQGFMGKGSWNKRWFSLTEEKLSYSQTKHDKQPSGVFLLATIIRITKSADQEFEVCP